MKEYLIGGLIGAVLVFILLKFVLKKKETSESKTTDNLLKVASTEQAKKLIKTQEFKELLKTPEFNKFAVDFGTEQLVNFILTD